MEQFHFTYYPNRKLLAGPLLSGVYDIMKDVLKEKLWNSKIRVIAVTCDGWKGPQMDSFYAVTGHWINHAFDLENATFGVVPFSGHQTGERIAAVVDNVVKELVPENCEISQVVCDNAANECSAGEQLMGSEDGVFNCFAHTVQLCVNDVVGKDTYVVSISQVREIVITVRKSGLLTEDLDEKLVRDVVTRWNSMLHMLQSFSENSDKIRALMKKNPKPFIGMRFPDMEVIDDLIEVQHSNIFFYILKILSNLIF